MDPAENLALELGKRLLSRHWQVTTAESCTGGGIACAITSVAGSSDWFGVGFVTYSNHHKSQLLGVSPNTLETCGAVSKEVVLEMALGALAKSGADIAVAVSGIAGPGGGTAEKPVGTVWFAWATSDGFVAKRHQLKGDRGAVRAEATRIGLRGLIDLI